MKSDEEERERRAHELRHSADIGVDLAQVIPMATGISRITSVAMMFSRGIVRSSAEA
jgi:hypothetical protein